MMRNLYNVKGISRRLWRLMNVPGEQQRGQGQRCAKELEAIKQSVHQKAIDTNNDGDQISSKQENKGIDALRPSTQTRFPIPSVCDTKLQIIHCRESWTFLSLVPGSPGVSFCQPWRSSTSDSILGSKQSLMCIYERTSVPSRVLGRDPRV